MLLIASNFFKDMQRGMLTFGSIYIFFIKFLSIIFIHYFSDYFSFV